ncbi:MAG: hypothetical protein JOZ84_16615 [Methylobacteriaceae bacterium]|nr:hypothetical protein [Methylobacteriaceae bacterium]
MNARHAIAALTAIALLGCVVECAAAPAQNNVSAPMPPPRPPDLGEQGQVRSPNPDGTDLRDTARAPGTTNATGSKGRASPQIETPSSKQTAPSGATSTPTPQGSDAVFPALPAASRARMRDCGREWEEMKRTGQAKELTWRDFATKCLTR